MKKDEIFFGDHGLTSTSANYIANMAKEMYQTLEKELQCPVFYNTTISTVSGDNWKVLSVGKNKTYLDGVADKLSRIAELKSLIAWLREAMKARDNMLKEVELYDLTAYCKLIGIKYPDIEDFNFKKQVINMGKTLTPDDYYGSLPIEKRNRYYEIETKASTLGKYIHDAGPLADGREKLKEVINNPTLLIGNDGNALIQSYSPSVDIDVVDDIFFKLQAQYREYQKELNVMKFECEKACQDSKLAVEAKYNEEKQEYNSRYEIAYKSYCSEIQRLTNELSLYIKKESARIMDLKILIPESLKKIYEEVNSIGKEKK